MTVTVALKPDRICSEAENSMRVCTTITRSYIGRARVLARSLARAHPGQRLAVLIVDAAPEDDQEEFDVYRPGDLALSLSAEEFARMSVMYESKELSTSLKPWFLTRLLAEPADCVLFIDPDCEIFAPLDHLAELTIQSGISLTPHSNTPLPLDGKTPTEKNIERSGIYNTGYLGVSPSATPFLDWFAERLSRDCLDAPERGLFLDQRWINFVPVYFDHVLIRDTTCNVAYWNLHERSFTRSGQQFLVDGQPLTFFHFSGFNPERPDLLTASANRIQISGHPELRRLCAGHAERLLAAGHREYISLPYALGKASTLPRARRRLYRATLRTAEVRGDDALPGPPDAASSDAVADWAASCALEQAATADNRLEYRLAIVESHLKEPVRADIRRLGALGSGAQQLVLRLLRPYRVHQEKTIRAVVDAIRETRSSRELDDP